MALQLGELDVHANLSAGDVRANERCKQILFFHSFTGSDNTSSFFKIGKCKWWDAWLRNTDISQTFQVFSYYRPICNEYITLQ